MKVFMIMFLELCAGYVFLFLSLSLFYLLCLKKCDPVRFSEQGAPSSILGKELERRQELHLAHKLRLRYLPYDFCNMAFQLAFLIFIHDPEEFPLNGIVVFTGRQGAGKTLSITEQALRLIKKYPKLNVYSNYDIKAEYRYLNSFDDLLLDNNGRFGCLALTDELQNLYNNKTSKEEDYGLMECICQNRKSHRLILTSTQQFYFLDKAIRSQVVEVRKILSFKILNFVIRCKPVLDKDMTIVRTKFKGVYFYIPSRDLYDSYDTYQKIVAKRKKKKQEEVSQNTTYKRNNRYNWH